MFHFQVNDPSLETQWRAIILFGKNSATYKFAFAKTLLEQVSQEKTKISLSDLADPFSRNVIEHLKQSDKQGSAASSKFLQTCRAYIKKEINHEELLKKTEQLGFVNVVDGFKFVNSDTVPSPF